MRKYFRVWVIILLLSSCRQIKESYSLTDSTTKKNEHEIMSEIYAQVLRYYRQGDSPKFCVEDPPIRMSALTDSYADLARDNKEDIFRFFPKLQEETWNDFLSVQSQQVSFPSDLDLGYQYVLVDNEPKTNCSYLFSKIAFNQNRDQALLILTVQDESFFVGGMYLLDFVHGQWKITDAEDEFYIT
jgi:hypothetical protein